MTAVRAAGTTVIAIDPALLGDRSLAHAATERIRAIYRAGDLPVLVSLAGAEPTSATALARFINGLITEEVPTSLLTTRQLDGFLASEPAGGVPFVVPDAADRAECDAYAIGLAARLGCAASFWTASDCIMSADSSHVDNAAVVEHLSFVELMELANGGQNVVGAQAIQLAWSTNTKFNIVALESGRWTSVTHDTYTKRVRPVASIAVLNGLSLIEARMAGATAETAYAASAAVLRNLAQNNLRIEQMQVLRDGLRFACDSSNVTKISGSVVAGGFELRVVNSCAKLCIVGAAMCSASGVLHAMMEALADVGVRPLQISDSNVTVTFLVAGTDALAAERAVHEIFSMRERVTADKQIAFDATTRILRIPDRSEKLGTRQAKLLNLLLENAGKIVDVETAARHVFGEATPATIAALRVHVHNLRKKIEDDPVDPQYILTIPNRGYTFARQWSASS